jgi:hypothetical protein
MTGGTDHEGRGVCAVNVSNVDLLLGCLCVCVCVSYWDFFLFSFYFIHMCIQCLGHFSPLPPALTFNPQPLATREKLFCPYL